MHALPDDCPAGTTRLQARAPAWFMLPLLLVALATLLPTGASAVQVSISPSKDNSLYELASGDASNGVGEYLFTGRTKEAVNRRAVIHFNIVASIPSGSTINTVTLQMRVSRTKNNTARVTSLHRLLTDWGEGTSNAGQNEGQGAPPTAGDATWHHRFYPGSFWAAPGGDFVGTATATVSVTGNGIYTWTGATLVAEVQSWLNTPTSNFGWLIRGDETTIETAKRFGSRESAQTANRPVLIVDYTPGGGGFTGACCYADTCDVMTAAACAGLSGTYQGDGTTCTPDPCPPTEPTGACCFDDGTCDTLTAAACATAGGTYQGDGTACTENLCPLVLTPFVDPLPIPAVAAPVTGTVGGVAKYVIPVTEQSQKYHRDLPAARVWGYAGTYPGPTIVASRDKEVTVQWVNDLRDSTGALRTTHYLPVDLCVHGPDMEGPTPRVVSHLHGGHVEWQSDGYPTSTILPGQSQTFHYPNHQLPATLWYHDHALGITRLNVMMGLAGFYLLTDSVETALGLPSGPYEIGLAIQDRTLRADGSIVYPATWQDHFFGDKAVVNGKVWPYLNVTRGKYRFRMLDGSTSRTYTFHLSNGAPFSVIGTEGGMLPAPVTLDSLTLTAGERADVIIDFAPYPAGTEIILTNTAPAPFPNGMPGEMPAITQIMKFVVQGAPGHTAPIPPSLRPITPLQEADATRTRDLVLAKRAGGPCGSEWLINGLHFDDVTEFPVLDSTEIWRFINRSGVTHPMHVHLTMFQVLDSQGFTVSNDSIIPVGSPVPPPPQQAGWKDTVPVPPNTIVRVIMRFEDYAGRYPYHCHILEHEENEMMRQFQVVHASITAAELTPPRYTLALHAARPNPFNPITRIDFEMPREAFVRVDVHDVHGRRIATLTRGALPAGPHHVTWDGRDSRGVPVGSGLYAYRLSVDGELPLSRKMILLK